MSQKIVTCKIGPSVLTSDLSRLESESKTFLVCGADYLHLDVMDGHFVPNITFGPPVIKSLRKNIQNEYFDVHMMVDTPEQWVKPMADAGVNLYTFHLESTKQPSQLISLIKDNNMKPQSPVEKVLPFISSIDCVLIMTVEPGFGGQTFMENMLPKVSLLRKHYPFLDIGVDGGVNEENISKCAVAGANMIVCGSALASSCNKAEYIQLLRNIVNSSLLAKDCC